MKLVIQKVTSASVTVAGEIVGSIKNGLCVLIGISRTDTISDAQFLAKKLLSLKLFEDSEGNHWRKSVKDCNYELLCVSQFTLHARLNKGAKPDFHLSMKGEDSKKLYEDFLDILKNSYSGDKLQTGVFGAMMSVNIVNDGPVTILLDSPSEKEDSSSTNSSKKDVIVKDEPQTSKPPEN